MAVSAYRPPLTVPLAAQCARASVTRRMSSVSVIVPCYNYGHYLPGCVGSILDQAGVDTRVLIIDDASPDGSELAAQELADRDPRVEVRVHPLNRGHIATYNEGLEWADGDYTVVLSADDLLVPGALSRAARLMDANPNVGFVYGRAVVFGSEETLPPTRTPSGAGRPKIRSGPAWLESRCRQARNCVASPEVVVRTSLQHDLGGYRPELPHSGDLEMWMRFATRADVGIIRDADQALYRVSDLGMQRTRFDSPVERQRQRRAAFDWLFRECGDAIPDVGRLRRLANHGLARDALRWANTSFDRGTVDPAVVDELVAFARETHPGVGSTRDYWALRWRQRAGPDLCRATRRARAALLLAPPRAWVRSHSWRYCE